MALAILAHLLLAAPAPPPEAAGFEPLPSLSDEFDGDTLDASKWHDHNPDWQGRQPGWFAPRNVAVAGGCLSLVMRAETLPDLPEGYHTYTAAAVKSRAKALYGFFEARCRPMRSRGSSAFWFYCSEPEQWTEIDVFEIGAGARGHERKVHQNVHVFHTPTEKEHWARPHIHEHHADLADDFHRYGLLWTPERLVFYFDGEPVHEQQNSHWHQPLHLNFDSETMPEWFGLPEVETLPSEFTIDYIRSWRPVE